MSPYEELKEAILEYDKARAARDCIPFVTGTHDKYLDARARLFEIAKEIRGRKLKSGISTPLITGR